MKKSKIIITTLAVIIAIAGTTIPALAYFTAHAEAKGSVAVNLGTTTTITEEFDTNLVKKLVVSNEGPESCYVRAKAFSAYDLKYSAEDNSWAKKAEADDYYYYDSILAAGGSTKTLTINVTAPEDAAKDDSFNVIVIYETTKVTYDEAGNPEEPNWDAAIVVSETRAADVEGGDGQ